MQEAWKYFTHKMWSALHIAQNFQKLQFNTSNNLFANRKILILGVFYNIFKTKHAVIIYDYLHARWAVNTTFTGIYRHGKYSPEWQILENTKF